MYPALEYPEMREWLYIVGFFFNVPFMYPYTIDWGLIPHVPKVMLMYLI